MRKACKVSLRKDSPVVARASLVGSNRNSRVSQATQGRKVNLRACRHRHSLNPNHSLASSRTRRRNSSRHKQEHQPKQGTRPLHKRLAPPRNKGRNLNRNSLDRKVSSLRVSSQANLNRSSSSSLSLSSRCSTLI